MSNVIIRKAKIEDLPYIQNLCNLLSKQSYLFDKDVNINWAHSKEGKKYYEERIEGNKGFCLIAEKENKIVGFASGSLHEADDWRLIKRVELDNVFITEQQRRSGIGKLFIDFIKKWAKEIKAERVTLTAYVTNDKALKFYERESFLPYEVTLEYKVK